MPWNFLEGREAGLVFTEAAGVRETSPAAGPGAAPHAQVQDAGPRRLLVQRRGRLSRRQPAAAAGAARPALQPGHRTFHRSVRAKDSLATDAKLLYIVGLGDLAFFQKINFFNCVLGS